ncbi:MAG: sortase [Actinobacteria bacterium]|nr:sortase [Actinomycetota bacterium]
MTRRTRVAAFALGGGLLIAVLAVAPLSAAPALTVEPITWNVIGLDSNQVSTGPDTFVVGARACNVGSEEASDVVADLVWDGANPHVDVAGPATLGTPSIPVGECFDFHFQVAVARTSAAFDTARPYRIVVSAPGAGAQSTPAGRELYVERLISQHRNEVVAITGPGGVGDPPATTVYVGETYTYLLHSSTAPGGYEQLEAFVNFPNVVFQILSVDTVYGQPPGATNDTIYADACGWENDPADPDYRSCVGPESYGGKAGGDVVTSYDVRILSPGSATVSALIYDFSGSSYHYNGDYGTGINALPIAALPAADLSIDVAGPQDPVPVGQPYAYTLTVTNAGPNEATGVVVSQLLPPGVTPISTTPSAGSCSEAVGVVACDLGSLEVGGTATIEVLVVSPVPGTQVTVASVSSEVADLVPVGDSDQEETEVVAAEDPPSPSPTGSPSPDPSGSPDPEPTGSPDPSPSSSPSFDPTVSPSPTPSGSPDPSPSPTSSASPTPTGSPPSPSPTSSPPGGSGPADLSVSKSHAGDLVVGEPAMFQISVRNEGGEAAAGPVEVVDALPAGLSARSWSGEGWSCSPDGSDLVCTHAGPVPPGAELELAVEVDVAGDAMPGVVNRVVIAAPGDPQPANDEAEDAAVVLEPSGPSPDPDPSPSPDPGGTPDPSPSPDPTGDPGDDPTPDPTSEPTLEPTEDPTSDPTSDPTPEESSTADPTPEPQSTDPGPSPSPPAGPDPSGDPSGPTQSSASVLAYTGFDFRAAGVLAGALLCSGAALLAGSRVPRRRRRSEGPDGGVRAWVRWTGMLCMAGAILPVADAGWSLWGTGLGTARSQAALREVVEDRIAAAGRDAEGIPPGLPGPGEPIALLSIPRIGLEAVVVEGVGQDHLALGPGHYPGTALPWDDEGRVAIAGHRTTHGRPFLRLDRLRPGDLIVVSTPGGTFRYRVRSAREVAPEDVGVLRQTARPTLVLTTCSPLASASRRLAVEAVRV